jgi:hypothetical protein
VERWRWKNSDFQAVQIKRGGPLPPGFCKGGGFDNAVVAYVTINGMPLPVRDGDWVRYGETGNVLAVLSDARIREQAVCLED